MLHTCINNIYSSVDVPEHCTHIGLVVAEERVPVISMKGKRTVCVTRESRYIKSWLVIRHLERRYHVKATVRDLGRYHQSCM